MAVGTGAQMRLDLQRLPANTRDVTTYYSALRLPYGIPGLNGSYKILTEDGDWEVFMAFKPLPASALEAHLERCALRTEPGQPWITEYEVAGATTVAPKRKFASIEPDRWGRSWRSEANITFRGFIDPTKKGDDPSGVAQALLRPVVKCLNKLLDGTVLAGGGADRPPLRTDDFWSVDVAYSEGSTTVGRVEITGLQTFWWRGPTPLPEEAQAVLRAVLQQGPSLPLEVELLVAAKRKLESSDTRGAVIDAICAVETVLAPFIRAGLAGRGIPKKRYTDVLGPSGLGLSDQLHVLLPLLAPKGTSKSAREAFAGANTLRNRIVHEGRTVSATEARTAIAAAESVIDELKLASSPGSGQNGA